MEENSSCEGTNKCLKKLTCCYWLEWHHTWNSGNHCSSIVLIQQSSTNKTKENTNHIWVQWCNRCRMECLPP